MPKLTDQQRYINSELSACSWWNYNKTRLKLEGDDDAPVPRDVRRAQALIKRYEAVKAKANDKFKREYGRKYAAVRREIYFGTPEKALKLVEALKKECGE